ncbi:MAG TPA: isoprenylcysteine carboxylmethyltransferase family protein [Methyloprofundus sp.]|nr:isoprenylcysteine carboxylmethyltransferase family protein [Methyloprofundus sp.]HIL78064.1 isoprenylcysteine carboxylmethyltransferase family protein [Methylococcales bacterium]
MFLRALLAFLMVPVVVAGIVPFTIALYDPFKSTGSLAGILPLAIGMAILLWCVRDFYISGKGTLAPWDPPNNLVTVGLYRFVRNPMYVGVILILSGWAILTGSPIVAGFSLFMSTAFFFRVKMHEEPWAERIFAAEWQNYKDNVPRWLPQLKAYYPEQ